MQAINQFEYAWEISQHIKKITPLFLSRKMGIEIGHATQLCEKIWLRRHVEARKLTHKFLEGDL